MDSSIARLVSIAGHPAVLMPIAGMIAARGIDVGTALIVSVACAFVVVGYSFYKTRRGDWVHIDASVPAERAQLNSRVGLGLLVAAGLLAFTGLHVGFPAVVGLSGLIVLVAHLLRGLAKLSLHVAFAVFSTVLVWPNHVAAVGLAVMAVAVGWSRIALRRHVAADIMLGAVAGVLSGLLFHVVVRLAA